MEKSERKWSARITDGRTIGRKCAFVVGLHNDSAYEDCIAVIELNHKEDADGWFEKYSKIAECMNAHSELQAKAEAYDRLMSGGKKTLKEWANIFWMPVAVDQDGEASSFAHVPVIHLDDGEGIWGNNPENYGEETYLLPPHLIDFDGDWRDSLTLPDRWEDA